MYNQQNECLIQALQLLQEDDTKITARHLELLKENISYDSFAAGLVAGVWNGYLAAKGIRDDMSNELGLSVSEQLDVLIEYISK